MSDLRTFLCGLLCGVLLSLTVQSLEPRIIPQEDLAGTIGFVAQPIALAAAGPLVADTRRYRTRRTPGLEVSE